MTVLDDEDRIRRVEYAIWGVRGDNGLVSEFRQFRMEIAKWREEERKRTEEMARERKLDVRWRIGTALTVVIAILGAASIVASAL